MASELKSIASTNSPQPPNEEEIRTRAYEIYLERGSQPGSELDDWLQAERDLGHISE
jgi:Protein of unknown function (DUF2934)